MASYYCTPGLHKALKNNFIPLEPCDLKALAFVALRYTWSPSVFKKDCVIEQCQKPCEYHRREENFLWSEYIAFDVDNNDGEIYPLEQAISDWQDSEVIIGTTKSHQKEKHTASITHPPQDRFRIITRWERRIESLAEFRFNVSEIVRFNSAFDPVCKDGARIYLPCQKIVYTNWEGFRQPVKQLKKLDDEILSFNKILQQIKRPQRQVGLPNHVKEFLEKGAVFGNSRNISIYVATKRLAEDGHNQEKILATIRSSPFDRSGFTEREIETTVRSALQKKN